MMPHPYYTPLASFTCGPHIRVCMRTLPLLPPTTASEYPLAHRHIGFQTFPTHFLPPPPGSLLWMRPLESRALGLYN